MYFFFISLLSPKYGPFQIEMRYSIDPWRSDPFSSLKRSMKPKNRIDSVDSGKTANDLVAYLVPEATKVILHKGFATSYRHELWVSRAERGLPVFDVALGKGRILPTDTELKQAITTMSIPSSRLFRIAALRTGCDSVWASMGSSCSSQRGRRAGPWNRMDGTRSEADSPP